MCWASIFKAASFSVQPEVDPVTRQCVCSQDPVWPLFRLLWWNEYSGHLAKISFKIEIIPVRCVPPAWKPYMLQFQWPPPDVAPTGSSNKQVWTDLQWSQLDVTSRGIPSLMSMGTLLDVYVCWGGTLLCDLSHDGFDVIPPVWPDRPHWKHYLHVKVFAGDNYNGIVICQNCFTVVHVPT